ncbi:hypothetical protein H650_05715 [Enterobacter sp. R4-368]|nr:hypothetical protein H650_05715 [Enterobacter sp. R4-368]
MLKKRKGAVSGEEKLIAMFSGAIKSKKPA